MLSDGAAEETTDVGCSGDVLKRNASFHCALEGFLTHRKR